MSKNRGFKKEKIACQMKVSDYYLKEMNLTIGQTAEDKINDMFSIHLEAFILSRIEGVRRINVYHKRPTFWQWLTRKHISLSVEVNCREVISMSPNAPKKKLYEIKQVL